MNLPRFLAARFLRPEGAFLSFVTVAAAGGIALAVAVLVLVVGTGLAVVGTQQALHSSATPT